MAKENAVEIGTQRLLDTVYSRGVGRRALVGGMHDTADHDVEVTRAMQDGHAVRSRNDVTPRRTPFTAIGAEVYLG